MDIPSRIRSGVGWLGFGKLVTQVGSLVFSVLTIRLLSPHDYGLMAIAVVFTYFLSLFAELGLRVKLVQMRTLDPDYVRAVYGLSICTNVVLVAGLMLASPAIAWFFREPEMTAIVCVLSLQFLMTSWAVTPDAMLVRNMEFRVISLIEMAQSFLNAGVTLLLAWLGYGVWSLVCGTISATALRTVLMMWASPFRGTPLFRFRGMGETLSFGGYVIFQRISVWSTLTVDKMLIGRVLDAHVLGFYQVAFDLAYRPLDKFGSVINITAFSGLSRVADEPETFRAYLAKGMKLLAMFGCPVFYGMAAVAPDLIPVLLGERWAPVTPIMQVLCIAMPFHMLLDPLAAAFNSRGRPRLALLVAFRTAIAIGIGISVGLGWGILGVASGWAVGLATGFLTAVLLTVRRIGLSGFALLGAVAPGLVCAAAMTVAVLAVRQWLPWPVPDLRGLAVSVPLGVVFYAAAVALLDRQGLQLLVGFVRRRG